MALIESAHNLFSWLFIFLAILPAAIEKIIPRRTFEQALGRSLTPIKKGQIIGSTSADRTFWLSSRMLQANVILQPYIQNPWLYASVKKAAINISRVPFEIYTNTAKSPKKVESGPLYDLFTHPNPMMTDDQLFEATSVWLDIEGEAFWVLNNRKNVTTIPDEIWVFPPSRFKHIPDPKTNLPIGWQYIVGGKTVNLAPWEVIHFKLFNPYDDVRGLAPWKAGQLSVEQDYLSSKYNVSFFRNGATVSGILKAGQNLTDDQYSRLRLQIDERYQGADKAHKIMILEGENADFKETSLSQKDMAFTELKNLTRSEIFAIYSTNEVVLGIYSDIQSYEGLKIAHKTWWQENLIPRMQYISQKLYAELFSQVGDGSQWGDFDTGVIEALQEDLADKLDQATKLYAMGWPINQINKRLSLGMEDVPWGDVWWGNISLVPISDDGSSAVGQETPPSPPPKSYLRLVENTPSSMTETGQISIISGNEYLTKRSSIHRDIQWKRFMVRHAPLEKLFRSKIKKWMYDQRSKILANLSNMIKRDITDMIFDDEKEIGSLKLLLKPLYAKGIQQGAEMVAEELGAIDFVYNPLDPSVLAFMTMRITGIAPDIVDTIKQGLRNTLTQGISAGESITELADRVREIYNFAATRSFTIARTESAISINGGRNIEMQKQGVKKREWLTARDEAVRESHRKLEGEVRDMREKFSNGLMFPGDPSGEASEVINCRCIELPIVED